MQDDRRRYRSPVRGHVLPHTGPCLDVGRLAWTDPDSLRGLAIRQPAGEDEQSESYFL
jgi:hypothetical protein